jgi:hypothetical protein
VGVNAIELSFDTGKLEHPQQVTVSAVNDTIAEAPRLMYGVITHTATSSDPNYNAAIVPNVTAEIADNDSPGVFLNPSAITIAEDGIEAPISATYQAELTTRPLQPVMVSVVASPQFTTSPVPITFTPQNWDQHQTITVTAVDDLVAGAIKLHPCSTMSVAVTNSTTGWLWR